MKCTDCHKDLINGPADIVVWTTNTEKGIIVTKAMVLCPTCEDRVTHKFYRQRTVAEVFCEIPTDLTANEIKAFVVEEIESSRLEGFCWATPALRNLSQRGAIGAFSKLSGWLLSPSMSKG